MKKIIGTSDFVSNLGHELIFNDECLEFLEQLSIMISEQIKRGEIDKKFIYFAQWTRRRNLLKLKEEYVHKVKRYGKGVSVHIAPSNVSTNALFTYVFGLLAGNHVCVRISKKSSEELVDIIKTLKKALNSYPKINRRSFIIESEHGDKDFEDIVIKAESLVVWGGDNTVNYFKSLPTQILQSQIFFPNRSSLSIMSLEWLSKSSEEEIKKIADKFSADLFAFGQKACSSPKVLCLYGKKNQMSINKFTIFIKKVAAKANEMIKAGEYSKSDHFHTSCDALTTLNECNVLYSDEALLVLEKNLAKRQENENNITLDSGCFIAMYISEFESIHEVMAQNAQTLTYCGLSEKELEEMIKQIKCTSICRVVEFGKALNITQKWDGHDIIIELSKEIYRV